MVLVFHMPHAIFYMLALMHVLLGTREMVFVIYTLSKSQSTYHLFTLIIISHVEPCSWQDTCHTYKNLVYDLAHHESPIAQGLERPTGILESHGFDSRWGLRKILFLSI